MFSYNWLRHLVQQASYSKDCFFPLLVKVKTKFKVSNTVGLLTVKGKRIWRKMGFVVLLYCIRVEDTLNQNLKSLCAHSLAASMKSFNWEYSELTLWRQVISKYAEITCFSQCYAACSVLTVYFITEYISGVSLRHGRMQRVISIQLLKMRQFNKQQGQPTWKQDRKHLKYLKRGLKPDSEIWHHNQPQVITVSNIMTKFIYWYIWYHFSYGSAISQ